MKGKSLVLLTVAMGCGLVAMLGVQKLLKSKNSGQETARVLVASVDVPSGLPLDETNTTFKEFPVDTIPKGAVTRVEDYEERALKTNAVAGQILMLAHLGERGVIGASADIPNGMRVVTVPVDSTVTHTGQIAPDDRVDLLITYKFRDMDSREFISKTRTILEYVKVFSVDNHRERSGESGEVNAKNVSLLVSPRDAHVVMLAKDKGTLHLALRSKTDTEQANIGPVDETMFEEAYTFGSFGKGGSFNELVEEKDLTQQEAIRQALINKQADQAGEKPDQVAVVEPPVQAIQPEELEPVEVVIPEPVTPQWEVVIYSGDVKRVEVVDDELQAAEEKTVPEGIDPTTWKGWLENLL